MKLISDEEIREAYAATKGIAKISTISHDEMVKRRRIAQAQLEADQKVKDADEKALVQEIFGEIDDIMTEAIAVKNLDSSPKEMLIRAIPEDRWQSFKQKIYKELGAK